MPDVPPPRRSFTKDDYRKNAEDALILATHTARNATGGHPGLAEGLALAARAQAEVANGWIALLNAPEGQ